jgi:hypothetical protein
MLHSLQYSFLILIKFTFEILKRSNKSQPIFLPTYNRECKNCVHSFMNCIKSVCLFRGSKLTSCVLRYVIGVN